MKPDWWRKIMPDTAGQKRTFWAVSQYYSLLFEAFVLPEDADRRSSARSAVSEKQTFHSAYRQSWRASYSLK
jgi:hypothetical protein